ncbi:hypothetical protein NE237_002769 [Protea cynaroides]|uniref:GHMP kinase N-terminal domain-containing protein n=1 Tax=Protea cynaroides TaxID=273540 RepID=A0A9Q0QRU0_9MAGN|nr:hypothetical protein NE237_002769 [Protea cynaroides]
MVVSISDTHTALMAICSQSHLKAISITPPSPWFLSKPNLSSLALCPHCFRCNNSLLSKHLETEPKLVHRSVKTFTPATIANLDPGFDFLGCAIDGLGDFVSLRVDPDIFPSEISISSVNGIGDSALRFNKDPLLNFAGIGVMSTMKMLGIRSVVLSLSLNKGLPGGSGLGSITASVAATVVAMNEIFGKKLSDLDLVLAGLESAVMVSGYHADNIAPAIMARFVLIFCYEPMDLIRLSFSIDKELFFVIVTLDTTAPY